MRQAKKTGRIKRHKKAKSPLPKILESNLCFLQQESRNFKITDKTQTGDRLGFLEEPKTKKPGTGLESRVSG